MAQRDFISNTQMTLIGSMTLSGTTPSASDWIDTRGFDGCTLVLVTGAVTDAGTAAGFSSELQEGDTSLASGASAVSANETLGNIANLTVTDDTFDSKVVGAVGYVGSKRYVRLNITGTTATSADVQVFALLGHPTSAKTTFVGASVPAT